MRLQLSDINLETLSERQIQVLAEALSKIFVVWDSNLFFPMGSNRMDLSNEEFTKRKTALWNLLWNYHEMNTGRTSLFFTLSVVCLTVYFSLGLDWEHKIKLVHSRSWSINIWLFNWPSQQVPSIANDYN
jgi:hypothetical protein